MSTGGPGEQARLTRRHTLLLVSLVLAALAVPRLLAYQGVSFTAIHQFEDMPHHLLLLDIIAKRQALDEGALRDAALEPFPQYKQQASSQLRIQWPPGVQYVASPLARLFGPASIWTVQLTNLLFSLLLAAGVAGLGAALADLRVGLWGAALTALCPALVASSWYLSLDYPLVAMVTVGLLLLWHTRGFTRLNAGLILAVWSAAGMLIKPSYVMYLLGPSIYVAASGLWRARGLRPRLLVAGRAAAALAVAVTLFAALSEPSWGEITGTAGEHLVQQGLPAAMAPWSLEWLTCNIKFAAVNMPWPLLLLALPGVVLLHLRRAGPAGRYLCVVLWCSYAVLTASANKMERYLQPVYPLLCLLAAWWICRWLPARWRTAALAGMMAVAGGTLVWAHLHPTPWLPAEYQSVRRDGGEALQGSAYHPLRYELLMPGRAFLDDLRRQRWDSDCDLSPVMDQVSRWTAALPDKRPLGFLYYQRELQNPMFPSPHHPPLKLLAGLLQSVRDRFLVVMAPMPQDRVPEPMRGLPRLLLISLPDEDPLRHEPGLVRLEKREVRLRCKDGQHRLALSLVRARQ